MTDARDNGKTDQATNAESSSPGITSAEQATEEWAGRIARWLIRGAARAREEAEDIWAEAQVIRRGR